MYIPEPWWGNDGSNPLHSIIINYNPGEAQCCQKSGTVSVLHSYATEIVNSGLLPRTEKWHWTNRAEPILSSLLRNGIITSRPCLNGHLSIELIPWHTKGVTPEYWKYIEQNARAVFDNVFIFASNEAARIVNSKLHNVVLLRMSGNSTRKLLSILAGIDKSIFVSSGATKSGNTKYLEFQFSSLSDTRFISFWGSTIRNGMPSQSEMNDFISII